MWLDTWCERRAASGGTAAANVFGAPATGVSKFCRAGFAGRGMAPALSTDATPSLSPRPETKSRVDKRSVDQIGQPLVAVDAVRLLDQAARQEGVGHVGRRVDPERRRSCTEAAEGAR